MFNKLFERIKKYKVLILQIEPTTRCQLKCKICPRSDKNIQWIEKDMPLELYKRIVKYFPMAKHIHLQGWGEPLLHNNIIEMIDMAKKAGNAVSITTNGLLLDKKMILELLETKLDIVGFSIGGSTDYIHSLVRGGRLDEILDNIKKLAMVKKQLKLKYPVIKISYMMTKDNIQDLTEILPVLKELEIKHLIATNLDYTPTIVQDNIKLFNCNEVKSSDYQTYINRAKALSKKLRINLKVFPLKMEEQLMCAASPIDTMFVTANGDISPCVYLNLPVEGNIKRIFCGKEEEIQKISFGNINYEELINIWENKNYKEFRDKFNRRINAHLKILPSEMSISALDEYYKKYTNMLKDYSLPDICKNCYKAYGV